MRNRFQRRIFAGLSAGLMLLVCDGAARAQFPPGGPLPGGGPAFGGPPPAGSPFGGMRRFDDALINAPLAALSAALKLTAGQQKQIGSIQEQVHSDFARLMTPPGGGPPDFAAMGANFPKIQKMDADGTAKIKALLTPSQKQALPGVLKDIDILNGAGIPPALLGTLQLTSGQKQRLAALAAGGQQAMAKQFEAARQSGNFGAMGQAMAAARKQMQDRALTVLDTRQKSAVEAYVRAHPPNGPGGFGFPGAVGSSRGQNEPAEGSIGTDVYVLVKKLNRINTRPAIAFSPAQSEKLSDLLEPLFEQPELTSQETRGVIESVRKVLTPRQSAALAALRDINRKSVSPSIQPPRGFGPFGAPGGGPPPPTGAPGGGPPPPTGAPGGFPGMPAMAAANPRANPFYTTPGNALAEQAVQDLRELLDALERVAPSSTARPVPVSLASAQKAGITTFHNDPTRKGWNQQERVLKPRNVDKSHFGRWWHTPLDGQVYAAPLVVPDVRVNSSAHDVVIAPTENNSVYALDADTGQVLWRQHLATPLTDEEYNDCINITPSHGITSTPVIDLDRKEIYVCGVMASKLKQIYKVWALDLETGAVKSGWPVTLAGTYRGTTFDGGQLTQRGALLMVNGWLYMPFASRCDIGEWHGWVMGVDTHNPGSSQRAFSSSPDTSGGGIWGSAGLAADTSGHLYAVTGNGDYNLDNGGHTIVEAIVRLTAADDLSFSYQSKDFYVPANHEELDRMDADLGGSSAIVLDHPGSATPHLLVTGGKDGLLYLVDRDNLGGIGGEVQKQRLYGGAQGGYGSFIKTTPAYFEDGQGGQYIVITGNDKGKGGTQGVVTLRLGLDSARRSQLTPYWSSGRPLYQPGTAVVSSNGNADAIVWVIESNKNDDDAGPPGVLHAYDARTGRELYRSNQRERRDTLGDARKFSAPTVANGRVYCGTNGIVAYGPIEERKNAK